MESKTIIHTFLFMLTAMSVSACIPSPHATNLVDGLNPEEEIGVNMVSEDPTPSAQDPMRKQLGSFFLVEHFDVAENPTMAAAIKSHQPGGIIFWNPKNSSAPQLRSVIRAYSEVSKAAGNPTMLFSADEEGGSLELTPSGKMIAGVQRFKRGFTGLAHPIWLGRSQPKFGTELCELHGKIMAREMSSVGMNYPLSVTSDLAERLFAIRGISSNPQVVSECMKSIMDQFAAQKNLVFVTKHFPGLGQTYGDSHDTVAMSQAKNLADMKPDLLPFRNMIADVNTKGTWKNFSVMASHGMFPLIDKDHITTESSKMLQGLLRKQLGFGGIVVSDAMWMGNYGHLEGNDLMIVYLKSFLAGMDMLMVPGSKFANGVSFFRAVYDESLDQDVVNEIERQTGLEWREVHAKFVARANESLTRINSVRSTLKPSIDIMDAPSAEPASFTTASRKRYDEILNQLSPQWPSVIEQLQLAL